MGHDTISAGITYEL